MSTEKTIGEHLKTLPLQKRLKAMENLRKQTYCKGGFYIKLNIKKKNFSQALGGSFIFSKTREGHDFWMEISLKHNREQNQ